MFLLLCYCSLCAGPISSFFQYLYSGSCKNRLQLLWREFLVSVWCISNATKYFSSHDRCSYIQREKRCKKEIEIIRLNSYLYSHTIIRFAVLHLYSVYRFAARLHTVYLLAIFFFLHKNGEMTEKWIWNWRFWEQFIYNMDLMTIWLRLLSLPKTGFWRVPIHVFIPIWSYELKHFIWSFFLFRNDFEFFFFSKQKQIKSRWTFSSFT